MPPQLAAASFAYTRLPHTCLAYVDPPPSSGVLAPKSDRYKKENAVVSHRHINRAQPDAYFPGTVIPIALPPVPPAPDDQNTSLPAKAPLSRLLLSFHMRSPLLAFPLLKWRPT